MSASRTVQATGNTRCVPSSITGRDDVFRCQTNKEVFDPCYRKAGTGDFLCSGRNYWTLLTGVRDRGITRAGATVSGDPVTFVRLANGGWCSVWPDGPRASSVPGYPVQVGHCSEGPYSPWAPWLGGRVQDASDYPLERGAAVVWDGGRITRVPVTDVRR